MNDTDREHAGGPYEKPSDEKKKLISKYEKIGKKIQEIEKRIRKKANKKLFGTTGVKIPVSKARDELYDELKNIWYQKAI